MSFIRRCNGIGQECIYKTATFENDPFMKIISRILGAALFASLLVLTSCKKDDTLQYGNVTLGNFVGDKFVSDQGNEFTIVENQTGGDFKDIKRAIMQCDVLRKIAGTDNGYEVRVRYVGEVLTKSPIDIATAAQDPEKVVENPIRIEDAWISGGYLNMYVMFEIQAYPPKENSKHMVNLVFDENGTGSGKYTMTLRHNAYGETLPTDSADNGNSNEESSDEDSDNDDGGEMETQGQNPIQWGLTGAYVCFQISDLIQENEAEITLKWNEHIIVENIWTAETHERTADLSYSKDNFEQAPLTLKSKTIVLK